MLNIKRKLKAAPTLESTYTFTGRLRRPRILIVEDDDISRHTLQTALVGRGCYVLAAENGAMALRILQAKSDEVTNVGVRRRTQIRRIKPLERPPVDLVLSDFMMPEMSGSDLFEAMRRTPHLAEIPIIFLSAHASAKHRSHALDIGAEEFLVKPINIDELIVRINQVLRQWELGQKLQKLNKTVLQGSLDAIRLDFVLHLMEMAAMTGFLEIRPPGHDTGYVYLADGRVAGARFLGQTGLPALSALLALRTGRYSLTLTQSLPKQCPCLREALATDDLRMQLAQFETNRDREAGH